MPHPIFFVVKCLVTGNDNLPVQQCLIAIRLDQDTDLSGIDLLRPLFLAHKLLLTLLFLSGRDLLLLRLIQPLRQHAQK